MKKGLVITGFIALMLILAGCKSAFQLPAGCDDQAATNTGTAAQAPSPTPVATDAADKTVQKVEDKTAAPAEKTGVSLKESEATTNENLPTKTVLEGDIVSFPHLKAVDPDGDKITYTFTPPLNNQGVWKTKVGDAGEYVVTITASDGKSQARQKVKLVVQSKNMPPVIQPISDISINEGDTVNLDPVVTDPENDKVTVLYTGWMTSERRQTKQGDAGKYVVAITASDGTSTVTRKVNVVVNKVNHPPVIEPISDIVIKEGDKMTVKPVAKDPDGDKLTFAFAKPLDENGVWQTKVGDAGTYKTEVSVTDGEFKDKTAFAVSVQATNRPPVLNVKEVDIHVDEGDVVTIHTEATDPDGDSVKVSFSGWMTSNSYTTNFDDQGVHTVTVAATDGINTVTKNVTVTVRNVNRPPVFNAGSFD